MLCYRGLNDEAQATREEKLYLRFKADEAARAITGPYALAHPEDNNEAQPIHEHESVELGRAEGRKQYTVGSERRAAVGEPSRLPHVRNTAGQSPPLPGGAASR